MLEYDQIYKIYAEIHKNTQKLILQCSKICKKWVDIFKNMLEYTINVRIQNMLQNMLQYTKNTPKLALAIYKNMPEYNKIYTKLLKNTLKMY